MRFASLGSGSRGNATLIEAGGVNLLIDCGLSVRAVVERLARLKKAPEDITAIVVTHEHADHVNGVGAFVRKYGCPVWMSYGTARASRERFENFPPVEIFDGEASFALDGISIEPITVPHDAREPRQFVFSDGDNRLALLTDTGSITPHIINAISGVHALLVEFNYDEDMLAAGDYPEALKARVDSDLGHLSNKQTVQLLQQLDLSRLKHLVALHLSENNNTPELVRAAAAEAIGAEPGWIGIADQDTGFEWRSL